MTSTERRRILAACRRLAGSAAGCVLVVAGACAARADDIRVFAGGAPQQALQGLAPEFEKSTGHKLHFTFALVTAIQQKLASGEKVDLVVLPVPLISATEKALPFRPEGRTVLARVGIGVIVRDGAKLPDLSGPEAIRRLLLEARAIALPHPGTPSGAHLAGMLRTLGIADAVQPKVIVKPAIDGGGDLVARGEADVGMYLLSEVRSVKGVSVAGLLPADLQNYVVYGTAIPAGNAAPEAADAFVKFVSHPGRAEFWKAAGFELMPAGK